MMRGNGHTTSGSILHQALDRGGGGFGGGEAWGVVESEMGARVSRSPGDGDAGSPGRSREATTSARAGSPAREARGAGADNLLRSDAEGSSARERPTRARPGMREGRTRVRVAGERLMTEKEVTVEGTPF